MSVIVRAYTHSGLTTPPVTGSSGRFTSDSLFLLKQPYLAGELLTATASAVSTAIATAPDGTKLLYLQIAPGGRVYFEVTPANFTTRVATTNSPIMEGNTQLEFGPNWTLSVLEAA